MTNGIPPREAPVARSRVEAWGDRPGPGRALADTVAIAVTAARLLARHWPVLGALFLGGILVRELAMRLAVRASLLNAELGMLVMLLAPLALLISLALMLRAVRPSLPWLGGGGPPPSLITHLGAVLVPFLTIYYFENYLYDDISEYTGRLVDYTTDQILEELAESVLDPDAEFTPTDTLDRLPYQLSITLVTVVVAAFLGRRLLSRWSGAQRHPWLGVPGAYLELVWLTLAYIALFNAGEAIAEWGNDRWLVRTVVRGWDEVAGSLTGLSTPVPAAGDWLDNPLGHFTAVIVVPIAWLAVGATVLGLREPPPGELVPSHRLLDRAASRWSAAPAPVRWVVDRVTADTQASFQPLMQGTRMLLRGGFTPMMLFCLAFAVARALASWLWELQRLLVGGQDVTGVWIPLYVPLTMLNLTVEYMLLMCLLAAAVDRALRASRPAPAQETSSRA